MKLPIQFEPAGRRSVGRFLVHLIANQVELDELCRGAIVTRRAGRRELDGFAVLVQVRDFCRGVITETEPAVHLVFNQDAFGNQLLQAFANRNATQVEFGCEVAFHQSVTGQVGFGENQPNQLLQVHGRAIDFRLKATTAFRHTNQSIALARP